MLVPTVQLKSGGYLVINQAEALVAIDVNSGRSTRERGIEETALRTNLEAADEVARQLRLRDLAGLIVIDFIDMESKKNNLMVERRLKEALKNDRARIQIGQISHFGLLEMSRQRLRPSLTETSFVTCPHCQGLGLVRNVESSAVHVLRQIEDEGAKARAGQIMVHVGNAVAMYILNNKRDRLAEIEVRYAMHVHFTGDETLVPPHVRIEKLRPPLSDFERAALAPPPVAPAPPVFEHGDEDAEEAPDIDHEAEEPARAPAAAPMAADEDERETGEDADETGGEPGREASGTAEEAERRRRRRRRRRGGRREDGEESPTTVAQPGESVADAQATPAAPTEAPQADEALAQPVEHGKSAEHAYAAEHAQAAEVPPATEAPAEATADPSREDQPSLDPEDLDENGLPKARRRGRRGGRRRRRDEDTEAPAEGASAPIVEQAPPPRPSAPVPSYAGPTPADPFGGQPFDIFDILERAEMADQAQAGRGRKAAAAEAPPAGLEIPPVPADATEPPDIVRADDVPTESAPEPDAAGPAPSQASAEEAPAETAPPVEPEELPAPTVPPVAAAPAAPAEHVAAEPVPEAPEQEQPERETAAAEPAVGQVIRPIVIGADPLPATERKRGWWRR